ncbi:MAG: PQQ-binding-like beta-propeller repeat protein, partial [Planctomycetota bacterium]|nr:PQQ-binding-like beta-propeller repeat protein [Planctomycetota bacterium]
MNRKALSPICALLVVTAFAGNLCADDWPSWSGTETGRARCSEEPILVDGGNPLALDWSQALGSQIISSPAVANGLVFVGTEGGSVLALREDTGATVWEYATRNAVSASPCVDRDTVYFVSQDGYLYAVRASTGQLLWSCELGGSPMASPIVVGNLLVVGTSFPNPRIIAFDVSGASPQPAWSLQTPEVVYSSPAAAGGNVFTGSNDGKFRGLNAATGASLWLQPYESAGIVNYSSPLCHGAYVFVCPGGIENELHRINAADGSQAAPALNVRPGGFEKLVVSSPARSGNTLFLLVGNIGAPSNALEMWAIDAATMTTVWGPINQGNTEARAVLAATPACTNPAPAYGVPSSVFAATQASLQLVARQAGNGSLLGSIALDSPAYSSPAIANARIFVASANGTVYAFRGQNSPPTPPTTLAPANDADVFTDTPTITWSGAADPNGDTVGFVLRYDTDGEVLDTWQAEIELAAGTGSYLFAAPVPDNTHISYAIRARDSKRAFSRWTATQHFWVRTPPAPPADFQAQGFSGWADLSWSASASPDVAGYELACAPQGQPLPPYAQLGDVLEWPVNGLTNGITYVFSLRAYDLGGLTSTPVEAQATPSGDDATPPVAGTVCDGPGADVDFQISTASISANWSGFADPESGIQAYEWAIGTTPGGTDVQGFLDVGLLTGATNGTVSLWHGQTCFATVRARNNAGLTTTATSDGVTVDTFGPTPVSVVVNGGAVYTGTTVVSLGLAASDGGSGVAEMRFMNDANLNGVADDLWSGWQPFAAASAWTLAPADSGLRRVFAQFSDGVGNFSNIVFDDIWLDDSPPVAGLVNDGTG